MGTSDRSEKPSDEKLFCPKCDYNLTGLAGRICPECGSEVDREQLRAALAVGLVPMMPWDLATVSSKKIDYSHKDVIYIFM